MAFDALGNLCSFCRGGKDEICFKKQPGFGSHGNSDRGLRAKDIFRYNAVCDFGESTSTSTGST